MPAWAPGVSSVICTTDRKRGIGAVRKVIFADGRVIEEHVVEWKSGRSFTYVATDGLPLRAYVAAITIMERPAAAGVEVTWQSYLSSMKMTAEEFARILAEMDSFYKESLANLKRLLMQSGG